MINRERISDIVVIILILLLSILSIIKIITNNYNILSLNEPDIPPYAPEIARSFALRALSIWRPINMGIEAPYATGSYVLLFISFLAHLGINGSMIYDIIIILSLFLSGVSLFYLSKEVLIDVDIINRNRLARLLLIFGSVFYMSSPFLYFHIISGHEHTLFSFALTALGTFLYMRFLRTRNYKYLILAGVSFGLSLAMINFLPFILLILFMITLLYPCGSNKVRLIALFIVIVLIFSINLFWILPLVCSMKYILAFVNSIKPSVKYIAKNAPSPALSMLELGYPLPLYRIGIGSLYDIWLIATSIVICLSFSLMLFSSHNLKDIIQRALPFLIIALISITFLIGFRTIFSEFLYLLYTYIPLMVMLRDVCHMHFLQDFSLAILLNCSIIALLKIILNFKRKYRFCLLIIFIAVVVLTTLIHSYILLTGSLGYICEKFHYPSDYQSLIHYFLKEKGDFRVLLLPMDSIVRYSGRPYYGIWQRDPILTSFPKPTFDLEPTVRSVPSYNFVIMLWHLINTCPKDLIGFLNLAGIKYIVVRRNPHGIIGYNYTSVLRCLRQNKEFKIILQSKDFMIFKNLKFNKLWRFFTCIPVLSDSINLLLLPRLLKLHLCIIDPLIYSSDRVLRKMISELKYSLNANPYELATDLAAAFSNYSVVIRTATFSHIWNPYKGWAPFFSCWWNWVSLSYYPYQPIISFCKKCTLNVPIKVTKSSIYLIFARIYLSKRGGLLEFKIDNKEFYVNTTSSYSRYKLVEIGSTYLLKDKTYILSIINLHGYNAVESIILIPYKEYYRFLKYIYDNMIFLYVYFHKVRRIIFLQKGKYRIIVEGNGSLYLRICNKSFIVNLNSDNSKEVLDIDILKPSYCNFTLIPSKGSKIRLVLLYPSFFYTTGSHILNYTITGIDSFKVKAYINGSISMITLASSFNPLWVAKVYNKNRFLESVNSVPVYGIFNGFIMHYKGYIILQVLFVPQIVHEYGILLSFSTLLICIVLVLLLSIRDIRKAKKS